MLEAFDFFLVEFFFGFSPDGRSTRLPIFDKVPEDAGEFVGHKDGPAARGPRPSFLYGRPDRGNALFCSWMLGSFHG